MRLAGLSDAILLEVARHRAANQPVLAGASLANLKNAGVRELTLLELVRRGVPDSQAAAIIAFRRHGATDAQIISHFATLCAARRAEESIAGVRFATTSDFAGFASGFSR